MSENYKYIHFMLLVANTSLGRRSLQLKTI